MKDLYAENYKTLIKEIEDDSKKWKYIQYSKNMELFKEMEMTQRNDSKKRKYIQY